MAKPKHPEAASATVRGRIRALAALRARNVSYADCARTLHCSASTLEHYPSDYPLIWKDAFREAWFELTEEAASEAMLAQRHFLREGMKAGATDGKQRLSQMAAHSILTHRRHMEMVAAQLGLTLPTVVQFIEIGTGERRVISTVDLTAASVGVIDHGVKEAA